MAQPKPAKKRSRDLEKTRAHILDVAFWEVYRNSFQGVSVDDIVKKTGLTKGAFYHHFPTKLDLGYALVDDVIKPMILSRWVYPLANHKNPLVGILQQLKTHIVEVPVEKLRYGCPLNNLVQEMAPVDRTFRLKLQNALNFWIDELEREIKRAQSDGYLRKGLKARQVAQFLVMAHEGFYGLIKGLDEHDAVESLYSSVKQYVDGLRA